LCRPSAGPRPPAPGGRPTGRWAIAPAPLGAEAFGGRLRLRARERIEGRIAGDDDALCVHARLDEVAARAFGQHRDAVGVHLPLPVRVPGQREQVHHGQRGNVQRAGRLDRGLLAARRVGRHHHVRPQLREDAPHQPQRQETLAATGLPARPGALLAEILHPLQEIEAEVGERLFARDVRMLLVAQQLLAVSKGQGSVGPGAEIAQAQRLSPARRATPAAVVSARMRASQPGTSAARRAAPAGTSRRGRRHSRRTAPSSLRVPQRQRRQRAQLAREVRRPSRCASSICSTCAGANSSCTSALAASTCRSQPWLRRGTIRRPAR
jgi:hypothetical protein